MDYTTSDGTVFDRSAVAPGDYVAAAGATLTIVRCATQNGSDPCSGL